MIPNFGSDYMAGAHPALLEAISRANLEMLPGYGTDKYSLSAAEKLRKACGCPEAGVFFLVGGTQTNSTVIAAGLRQYEGVIAAETGHIAVHEAGAVEYTGHKVLTLPQHDGKIDPGELDAYMKHFYTQPSYDHTVFPGMVYISHPTESGTLYSLSELKAIHKICREYDMPLFVDGARLAYGLMSYDTDVSLPQLAENCDVFYAGGTKCGALFGEAVIYPHGNAPKGFYTQTKQHGAMLAKGWITGVMYDALFTDGLYFDLGRRGIETAQKLKGIFRRHGIPEYTQSPTNQQFILLSNDQLPYINAAANCGVWEIVDDTHTALRFVTSWATTDEDLEALDKNLSEHWPC